MGRHLQLLVENCFCLFDVISTLLNILPSREDAKIVDGRIWVSIFSSKWRTGLSDVLSTLLDALPGHTNAKFVDGRIRASNISPRWRIQSV